MARFSSLGGLLRRVRVSRGGATGTEASRDQTSRADDAAEAAAMTTERIRRVVQGAKPQTAETDATQAPPPPAAPAAAPPAAPADSAKQTQILWGKEFTLTEGGLSAEQVVPFVEALLSRNKELEEQSSPAAMSRYVEKLMGELQTVEETVRAQATRDAELEAAKITAEARRTAQEEIMRARSEAASQAQKYADAILSEARKKAEIAEGQVRIQAQLMLGKARDQVQEHIRKEGELAFSRVMASLSTLVQEAQTVESEWKQQTARLWIGAEAALSTSADLSAFPLVRQTLDASRGPAPAAPARQAAGEAPPSWPPDEGPPDEAVAAEDTASREPVQPGSPASQEVEIESVRPEEPPVEVESAEAVVDMETRAEVAPEAEEATITAAAEGPDQGVEAAPEQEVSGVSAEVAEPEPQWTPSVPEEATRAEVSDEPAVWTAAPVEAEVEPAEATAALDEAELVEAPDRATVVEATDTSEPPLWTAAPVAAQEELAEAATVPDEEELVEPAEEEEDGEAADTAETPPVEEVDEIAKRALYAGEIELALAPPVDPALLARLYSSLLAMSDLRILRTMGSWDSGTTINLLLERPQPLITRLLEIPEVHIAPGLVKGPLMGSGGDPGDRIAITLRE